MYRFASLRAFGSAAASVLLGAAALSLLPSPVRSQASVLTQNNDNARTGANTQETILTPFNVNTTKFGKLFTLSLDTNVNGQALYVPNVTLMGGVHNALYVYTSSNANGSSCSVYAFDADNGAQLWHTSLTDSTQYTTPTPVIDATAKTMYVLTKDVDSGGGDGGPTKLHAFDITTGQEKQGSPVTVAASVPGTGDGSAGGVVTFNTAQENDRAGLLLLNGIVYIGFAHNSDSYPYHGWVLAYQYTGSGFTQTAKFCTTPNGGLGGIWMSGMGLTADTNGYIYCTVGNGTFDADTGGSDYGMCVIKLRPSNLSVVNWFAPFDELGNSNQDLDFGNCGALLVPGTNRLFTGGTKFGSAFLLDSTHLGGYTPNGPDSVLDRIDQICSNDNVGQNPVAWDTGAYKYMYVWPMDATVRQFRYDPSAGSLSPSGIFKIGADSATCGGSLAISSNGGVNGILWGVGYDNVVRAYNANDVSQSALWSSSQNSSRDALGSVGHFQWPTVVNGKVYVPNGAAGIAVYGLLPSTTSSPAHLLWDNTNGQASLWTENASTGNFTNVVYGPYSGWTARATADSPDGTTHLLWTNTSGQMALWTVAGGNASSTTYGPFTGWTAQSVSVGPDGTVHVLWNKADGTAALWRVNSDTTYTFSQYGPFSGWTARALADGPDNQTRILWNNASGEASLWSVAPDDSFTSNEFGPYASWSANAIAAGPDNLTRLIWGKTDGTTSVWSVDSAGNTTHQEYGPFTGWSAVGVAVGSDDVTRLLWNLTDGTAALWSLNNTGGYTYTQYGPYSGWAVVGVSAGP